MGWEIFQRAADNYEGWYTTPRGQQADSAERALLKVLLEGFGGARTVLEVGSGTGHFARWLAESGFKIVGLDRTPAMVRRARQAFPSLPLVLGDAHQLPFRAEAVDVVLFITTLEFLENTQAALAEAVRVARRGIVAIVLNRYSLGGLSRRSGAQSRGSLLGQARDYSLGRLRRELRDSAGARLQAMSWSSTLFPNGLWHLSVQVPLGDVIGVAASLAA